MSRRRLLKVLKGVGSAVFGAMITGALVFVATIVACEALKSDAGSAKDSPMVFGLLMASTLYVPLGMAVGGWTGWRFISRPLVTDASGGRLC